jgi:p25-alpha
MDYDLEELYLNDEYLQLKLQELSELNSELMCMNSSKSSHFETGYIQQEKDHQDSELTKKATLLKKIGKDMLEVLRKVFMKYTSIKNYHNVRKLESLVFHKFLEDAGLYSKTITKVTADLMFYKNLNAKTIDFWRFVEILIKISGIYYVNQKKYDSLVLLLNSKIINNCKFKEESKIFADYHEIFMDETIKSVLKARKPTLKTIFNLYKSTDYGDLKFVPNSIRSKKKGNKVERVPRITLKGFISFLTAFELLPGLISGLVAAKLFRAVPSPLLFNECLDYKEFTEACAYTSLRIYQDNSYKELCQTNADCLEMWFKFLDAHPRPLIETPNPMRNTVYTLKQFIDYS